jgi:L-iditol 2-dehydrogenase
MRALVYDGPGLMRLERRTEPRPGPGEAVVAVHAAGICGSDVHGYAGTTGRRRPGVVMGHEAAGRVASVGDGVTSIVPGGRVAIRSLLPCGRCTLCLAGRTSICPDRRGLGMHLDGAYADAVVVPETMLLALPDSAAYPLAALIEPLAVAMHGVAVTPRELLERVVIVGAGTIGLLTLLAARLAGAGRIAVVDRLPRRLDLAMTLGADAVIDAGSPASVAAVSGSADAVFEAVGVSGALHTAVAAARPGGQVTLLGNLEPTVQLEMQEVVTRELSLRGAYGFDAEFGRAAEAIVSGEVDVSPLIELTLPLEEGPRVFHELAHGTLDAVKVILAPAT